jgi:hypothetical protein
VAALPKDGEPLKIFVNGRPFALKGEKGRLYMNGQEVSPDEFVIDNAAIITRDGKPAGGMVSNVLSEMELPQPTRPGQRLNLMVDGVPASFSTKVKNGAQLIIGFE